MYPYKPTRVNKGGCDDDDDDGDDTDEFIPWSVVGDEKNSRASEPSLAAAAPGCAAAARLLHCFSYPQHGTCGTEIHTKYENKQFAALIHHPSHQQQEGYQSTATTAAAAAIAAARGDASLGRQCHGLLSDG